ncbi:MAG: divalent-cation tolerance protein CutA [Longimicrobiales bacterium]
MTDEVRVVLMTAPDLDAARELGHRLVEERLAACANIVPGLTSIFHWNAEVKDESEVLLVLKTTGSVVGALVERAAFLHPYDVPEVLVLPVVAGYSPYLDWVRSEVGAERQSV